MTPDRRYVTLHYMRVYEQNTTIKILFFQENNLSKPFEKLRFFRLYIVVS